MKPQSVDTLKDARHALRRLVRDWPFTTVVVAILSLGIGANTALFSVVNTALFRPQTFPQPDDLVNVYQNSGAERIPDAVSLPAYRDISRETAVFAQVSAFAIAEARCQGPDGIRPALIEFATSSYLSTLGLSPAAGRWFDTREDGMAAAPVAVIGYRAWRDRYGGDPEIVGATVRINGFPLAIVGVAPPHLHNSSTMAVFTDFWLPISALPTVGESFRDPEALERRDILAFQVKARLREGVSVQQAQAAMDVLAVRLQHDFPDSDPGRGMTVLRAKDVRFGPRADAIITIGGAVLLGIVGLVLVIACSNLSTLLLVRGSSRVREISLRLALGATRRQLIRLLLYESALPATAGAAGGWLVALWCLRTLSALDSDMPIDVGLDYRVLGYTAALSLITGIGSGLAPALASTKVDLATALREGRGVGTSGRNWLTLKNVLTVGQVAASFVLLMVTAFSVRTVANAAMIDPGFQVKGVAILETDTRFAGYDLARSRELIEELTRRIEAIPGVEGAFATAGIPPTESFERELRFENYSPPEGEDGLETNGGWASPGLFEVLRIPVLFGRAFSDADTPDAPRVAVLNQTMARRYFGSPNAVGKRFTLLGPQASASGDSVEIIGVVGDTLEADDFEGVRPTFYLPLAQAGIAPTTIAARTSGDESALVQRMQQELRRLDPGLPVLTSDSMQHYQDDLLKVWKGGVAMLGGLAALGLALASLGLYAVVAFAATRRSYEMGVRLALGALHRQVIWLVMRDVSLLLGAGVLVGSGISLGALALMGAYTPSINAVYLVAPATDPRTLLFVAAFLTAVGLLAAYSPARRATRANPLTALRST